MAISDRSICYKSYTVSTKGCENIYMTNPDFKGKQVTDLQVIRGTQMLFGLSKRNDDDLSFFMKPLPGQKGVDCTGYYGPAVKKVHFINSQLVLLCWEDPNTKQMQSFMFNQSGRFLGRVEDPSN